MKAYRGLGLLSGFGFRAYGVYLWGLGFIGLGGLRLFFFLMGFRV